MIVSSHDQEAKNEMIDDIYANAHYHSTRRYKYNVYNGTSEKNIKAPCEEFSFTRDDIIFGAPLCFYNLLPYHKMISEFNPTIRSLKSPLLYTLTMDYVPKYTVNNNNGGELLKIIMESSVSSSHVYTYVLSKGTHVDELQERKRTKKTEEYARNTRPQRCYLCNKQLEGRVHIDHVIPFSEGGIDSECNFLAACGTCNQKKYKHRLITHLLKNDPQKKFDITNIIHSKEWDMLCGMVRKELITSYIIQHLYESQQVPALVLLNEDISAMLKYSEDFFNMFPVVNQNKVMRTTLTSVIWKPSSQYILQSGSVVIPKSIDNVTMPEVVALYAEYRHLQMLREKNTKYIPREFKWCFAFKHLLTNYVYYGYTMTTTNYKLSEYLKDVFLTKKQKEVVSLRTIIEQLTEFFETIHANEPHHIPFLSPHRIDVTMN